MKPVLATVGLCALACATLALDARGERFVIRAGAEGNSVVFVSKAPLETFEGRTDQITGRVELDPSAVGDSITVNVEVDLATLDTGIDKRNRHMRENHLETDTYPKASFSGARILGPKNSRLDAGTTVTYEITGEFALHGVTREITVPVDVTLQVDGGVRALHVVARFEVTLADFDIARPKFLFLKLDEVQRITFDVVAVAE